MMKTNFLKVLVVLFVGTLILEGCRKGENDPLISLKTRDARVSGEWELVNYESTRTNVYKSEGTTVTQTYTNTYNGTTWTETDPGDSDSYAYSRELIIEKNGNYTYIENDDGDKLELDSKWSWLDDGKKKTRIVLDDHGTFTINQLKNKEMIFTDEWTVTEVDDDGDEESTSYSMKAVYEKK